MVEVFNNHECPFALVWEIFFECVNSQLLIFILRFIYPFIKSAETMSKLDEFSKFVIKIMSVMFN